MRTIYKYPLDFTGTNHLELQGPILSCGIQGDQIMVWAVHDDAIEKKTVKVEIVGTGHALFDLSARQFLGTVFIHEFVFHLFVVQ